MTDEQADKFSEALNDVMDIKEVLSALLSDLECAEISETPEDLRANLSNAESNARDILAALQMVRKTAKAAGVSK